MNARQNWFVYVTLRETFLLLLGAVASALFYLHRVFYGGEPLPGFTWDRFLVLTLIVYVFVRALSIVAMMRPPRVRAGLELCPECGQELSDGTPRGMEVHRRAPLTPHPSEKEILAAVALRIAIDRARMSAKMNRLGGGTPIPRKLGEIENAPVRGGLELPPTVSVTPRHMKEPRGPKGPA